MSVPLDVWADVMQRHPLKFKFGNTKGFYSNRRSALRCDKAFIEKAYECELDANYRDYEENKKDIDPDGNFSCASEYAAQTTSELFDIDEHVDCYLVGSPDEAAAEYPITEVLDPACDEGVPVADVLFICPVCEQQPVWREVQVPGDPTSAYIHNLGYCGLCGGSVLFRNKAELLGVLADLGVDVFPFRVFESFDAYADLCVEYGLSAQLDDFEEPFSSAKLMTHKGAVIYACDRVMDELMRATIDAAVKATKSDNLV